MIKYEPKILGNPNIVKNVPSSWGVIPPLLIDIITRFKIGNSIALEFGVECGYSTSAISNYFKKVIGVDTFRYNLNDLIANRPSNYNEVLGLLKDFPNIELVESLWEDFTRQPHGMYDIIHIDIIHKYKETYDCGDWSLRHSNCVLFHDTDMPDVMRAVDELSIKHGFTFYNYFDGGGLGILVK